jgi:alpha-galactosidase
MDKTTLLSLSRRKLLQNGLLWMSSSLVVKGLSPEVAFAEAEQRWIIGNDCIARTMTFHAPSGLLTERLSDLSTQVDFIAPEKLRTAREFSFQCNGRFCAGGGEDFDFAGAESEAKDNAKSLQLTLRHKELPLEVAVVYQVYNGHPAIRKHLVLRNTGSQPLRFSHLNIESLGIALGPEKETTLLTQYGTIPREIFYTGRSEDACLIVSNARSGNAFAILSEVPGYMKRTEIGGWNNAERVQVGVMYDTDLMPFERTVRGGEQFATAGTSLLTLRHGDGFHDPRWVLPSYSAGVLVRRVNAQGPPWIYNTWEPFERSINREIALELIEAAANIGIDVFTIDDGWQQEYGENAVNLKSFPGGLQPILDVVESKQMRLGLWIPLAAIGRSTEEYRSHPEWATLDLEGKPKTTSTMGGDKVVMCMASSYRDAAADRVIDAIQRFRLAYVKLDITTIFNAYGEAPGCWAKGHDHGSWAESLNMIYEGIAYVTHKIYARHPDVLLDLTFELWGQKHVIDAGLLVAGDLDWLSNVDDSKPDSAGTLQARQLLYQRAASMPVESMLIGNMHADMPNIQESFATAIGSAPVLLGDLRKLSTEDQRWYSEKVNWFKKLRRKTKISEGFFPLGSWLQPSAANWDGFARLARTGDGVIALFRNEAETATALVNLPLMPQGSFKLRSALTGKEFGVLTQADWNRGVSIPFSTAHGVEVLEVLKIS